jgi:hypothetical protein
MRPARSADSKKFDTSLERAIAGPEIAAIAKRNEIQQLAVDALTSFRRE